MDSIVLRPGRCDGLVKVSTFVAVQTIVLHFRGRVPIFAARDGFAGIFGDIAAGIILAGPSTNVLQTPFERSEPCDCRRWSSAGVRTGVSNARTLLMAISI